MFHDTEECPKFEENLTLDSKNDMRNLVNFNVKTLILQTKITNISLIADHENNEMRTSFSKVVIHKY